MRRPTPDAIAFAYWRRAIGGVVSDIGAIRHLNQRHDDDVEPGLYKTKMVRGGPFVPVSVIIERETDPDTGDLLSDEQIVGVISGQRTSFRQLEDRWHFFRPITEAAYHDLCAAGEEGARNADIFRATHKQLDLSLEPVLP